MEYKIPAEIMAQEHWAMITYTTTHHPGDERSRTHPGHGYPAHTTSHLEYTPFETEAEAILAVKMKKSTNTYFVIKAQPLEVNTVFTLKEAV